MKEVDSVSEQKIVFCVKDFLWGGTISIRLNYMTSYLKAQYGKIMGIIR